MQEPREQIDRIEHSSFLTCKSTEAQISTKPKTIRWAHNKADIYITVFYSICKHIPTLATLIFLYLWKGKSRIIELVQIAISLKILLGKGLNN